MCGCGALAPIAGKTDRAQGWVRGQPKRFIHGHRARLQSETFEGRWQVAESGCWLWEGTINPGGYGLFGDRLAHRVMWERRHGPIPDALHLDHLCHERGACAGGRTCLHRRCVNLDHLALATPAANQQRGSKASLLPEEVLEIRASTERTIDLAARYAVAACTISQIRHRRTWKNL